MLSKATFSYGLLLRGQVKTPGLFRRDAYASAGEPTWTTVGGPRVR
jgi:hypothetical protein